MGGSQKPYNLACRVTEDHRYNPESDTVGSKDAAFSNYIKYYIKEKLTRKYYII